MPDIYCIAMLVSRARPECHESLAIKKITSIVGDDSVIHYCPRESETTPNDLRRWFSLVTENLHDNKSPSVVVITWHPGVLSLFSLSSRQNNVFLWDGTELTKLTWLRDMEWLVNQDLGKLYWTGQFDEMIQRKGAK